MLVHQRMTNGKVLAQIGNLAVDALRYFRGHVRGLPLWFLLVLSVPVFFLSIGNV